MPCEQSKYVDGIVKFNLITDAYDQERVVLQAQRARGAARTGPSPTRAEPGPCRAQTRSVRH